jgi:hypothetical protein
LVNREEVQMTERTNAATLAPRIKDLLEDGEFDALAAVLDPQVTWSAPDSPDDGCRDRAAVLDWWRRAYDAGMRAEVAHAEVHGEAILVSLHVRGGPNGARDRFQVLVVGPRGVRSIVGFETHAEALACASASACGQ